MRVGLVPKTVIGHRSGPAASRVPGLPLEPEAGSWFTPLMREQFWSVAPTIVVVLPLLAVVCFVAGIVLKGKCPVWLLLIAAIVPRLRFVGSLLTARGWHRLVDAGRSVDGSRAGTSHLGHAGSSPRVGIATPFDSAGTGDVASRRCLRGLLMGVGEVDVGLRDWTALAGTGCCRLAPAKTMFGPLTPFSALMFRLRYVGSHESVSTGLGPPGWRSPRPDL